MALSAIRRFMQMETAGGITLAVSAAALVLANLPGVSQWIAEALKVPVEVRGGSLELKKNVLLFLSWKMLARGVTTGIGAALLIGKPIGETGGSLLAVKTGLARIPAGVTWTTMLGVSQLRGIGFTMSLFIVMLAFDAATGLSSAMRAGVFGGSLLVAAAEYAVLRACLPAHNGR